MIATLYRFSSVVVGEAHNPTILNPNFLEAEGIVPKSWGWKVKETMTTPPLAVVKYENGVAITVEQNKLQVTDLNVEGGLEKSKVGEIASAYVTILRHVRYTAVGNNFQSVIKLDSPYTYLKNLFLKDGPWNNVGTDLNAVGIRLVYPLTSGRFTLSIDSGEANLSSDDHRQPVVLSNANFNRDCSSHPAFDQVSEFLQKAKNDCDMCQSLLNDIFEEAE
jgi:hypothetical protein